MQPIRFKLNSLTSCSGQLRAPCDLPGPSQHAFTLSCWLVWWLQVWSFRSLPSSIHSMTRCTMLLSWDVAHQLFSQLGKLFINRPLGTIVWGRLGRLASQPEREYAYLFRFITAKPRGILHIHKGQDWQDSCSSCFISLAGGAGTSLATLSGHNAPPSY